MNTILILKGTINTLRFSIVFLFIDFFFYQESQVHWNIIGSN